MTLLTRAWIGGRTPLHFRFLAYAALRCRSALHRLMANTAVLATACHQPQPGPPPSAAPSSLSKATGSGASTSSHADESPPAEELLNASHPPPFPDPVISTMSLQDPPWFSTTRTPPPVTTYSTSSPESSVRRARRHRLASPVSHTLPSTPNRGPHLRGLILDRFPTGHRPSRIDPRAIGGERGKISHVFSRPWAERPKWAR
jgi:hypothetical protein